MSIHVHVRGWLTVLLLCLVLAKVTGGIDWSWWWVLAPLWVPLTLGMAGLALAGLCTLLARLIPARKP